MRAKPSVASAYHLPEFLEEMEKEEWEVKANEHYNRMMDLFDGKIGLGGKAGYDPNHPIYNFLFEYYQFKPRKMLVEYSPGSHILLKGATGQEERLFKKSLVAAGGAGEEGGGVYYCPSALTPSRAAAFEWTLRFLRGVAARPPVLHCHGLHEWAMLYRPEGRPAPPKHQKALGLRISQGEINKAVEARTLQCTHFDAFRFFVPEARPFNKEQLTREAQAATDQPGCVHATMDLFKWALKLCPLLPSATLAEAAALALEARALDVRASPYDARAYSDRRFDLSPIKVETAEGRVQYQHIQEGLWQKSIPLRASLIEEYEKVLRQYYLLMEEQEPGERGEGSISSSCGGGKQGKQHRATPSSGSSSTNELGRYDLYR